METKEQKAFVTFNPAPVCTIKRCPEKTVVRMQDGQRRFDMCAKHGAIAFFLYRNAENITIVDAWGGYKKENFEKALEDAVSMTQEEQLALLEEQKEKEENNDD